MLTQASENCEGDMLTTRRPPEKTWEGETVTVSLHLSWL